MKQNLKKLCLLLIFIVLAGVQQNAFADGKWFFSIYGGQFSDNDLKEVVVGQTNFKRSHIAALAIGKELWKYHDYLNLEAEGQFVKHWGRERYSCSCPACGNPGYDWAEGQSYSKQNTGRHEYEEYNAVLVLRWLKFPWNQYVNTSLAFGEGLSYATKLPPVEMDQHAINQGHEYKVSKLLNYLLVELSFSIPRFSSYSTFARIHHRSGIFGFFNDVNGGSNFIAGGIRATF